MNSFALPSFWKSYENLPKKIQEKADRQFLVWKENPHHPSLHFKKLSTGLWSVRIDGGYRALAREKDQNFYWFWIGSHEDYNQLI